MHGPDDSDAPLTARQRQDLEHRRAWFVDRIRRTKESLADARKGQTRGNVTVADIERALAEAERELHEIDALLAGVDPALPVQ